VDQYEAGYQVLKLLTGKHGLFFGGRQIWESDEEFRLLADEHGEQPDTAYDNRAAVIERQGKCAVFLGDAQIGGWYDQILKDGEGEWAPYLEFSSVEGRQRDRVMFKATVREDPADRQLVVVDGTEYGPFEFIRGFEGYSAEMDEPSLIVKRGGKYYLFVDGRLLGPGFEHVCPSGYNKIDGDIIFFAKVDGKDVIVRNDVVDSSPHDYIYLLGMHQGRYVCQVRDDENWRIRLGEEDISEAYDDMEDERLTDGEVIFIGTRNGSRHGCRIVLP